MTDRAIPLDTSSRPSKAESTPFGRVLVIAALALATGVSLLAPGLALTWARQPFLGVLLEHTLVVAGRPSVGWTGQEAGLDFPDRILRIEGVPVACSGDLSAELRRHTADDVVTVEVEGPDGAGGWQIRQIQVPLMRFPFHDLVTHFLVAYVVGLIYLALGTWVFLVKGHRTSGRAFAVFCAILALFAISYFDLISTHRLVRLWTAAVPFAAAAAMHLGLVFPQERTFSGKWRAVHYLPYAVAGIITAWGEVVLFNPIDPRAYFVPWRWSYNYAGVAIVTLLGLLFWTRLRPATPEIRQQARIILLGSGAAFAPIVAWVFSFAVLRLEADFQVVLIFPPLILFPLSIAYAIVRHRLLDVNLVISRSLMSLVLTVLIVSGYFAILSLLGQTLRITQLASHPVALALFVLALVLFLEPLRLRTQRLVDRIFYRDRPNYRQELEEFSRALTATLDLPRLLDMFLERVGTLMHAERGAIYLYDPEAGEYTLQRTWGIPHPDALMAVRFRERDATVKWLKASSQAQYLTSSEGHPIPVGLSPEERARLTDLQTTLCAPFFLKGQFIGWLALGPKLTRDLYSPDDLTFLTALADQTAMAIENARLFQHSEARAHELAILNEVGQTITSTLDLTSVLNLIMGKMVELLDVEAGSLLMLDETGENLVFKVALGPVQGKIEGARLPLGTGIAGTAAREGKPYIVNNAPADPRWYSAYDKGSHFSTQSILAVPLCVKGETIGVIEAVNKRNGRPFTDDELTLLTSFAAQAAIAVENARLFTQTDQELAERVAELSTFQEIDRQLNATLDFERVINLGLEWAMRTTGAAAGSIGAMTPERDGLWLIAARGYASDDTTVYREKPWPVDRGIVGRVARTGEAALATDVSRDPDYVGFARDMQAQLSVPLTSEGQVMGVISLESRDIDAFDETDLAFMQRLADHISIAMTNARLYADVKAANEAKSEFVSVVSHELKAPMTSIKGYTRLLQMGAGGDISEKQRSFLDIINSSVDRMDALVQDLLDISRIETGRMKLELRPVSLAPVLDEVVRLLRNEFEARQQIFSLHAPPDLPPVRADRARLAQVLTNLLGNAYKYTPPGGSISLRAEVHNGTVLCSVADTGIGIAPEDQGKLFEKFYRANDDFVRQVEGTGLGLSIAKSIIELQGGEIWVESEVGKGSVFRFTVPVATG
jgi:signal transduction histidine kinase